MDSDSDDDILPNFNTFNEMFSKVQQQAKLPATEPSKPSRSKPAKLKKKDRTAGKTKSQSPPLKSKSTPPSKKDSVAAVEISDDTKDLLAEIDRLTNSTNSSSMLNLPDDPSITKPQKPMSTTKSSTATRTTRRAKRGSKKTVGHRNIVQVSDDDSDCVPMEILNTLLDSPSLHDGIEAKPPEELYPLRIRWKQDVMRFRVPLNTTMGTIRMQVAERVSTRADNLVILDEVISEEVSDSTLVGSIPFGKTLEAFEQVVDDGKSNGGKVKLQPGYVNIKLQGCGGYRERCTISMKKTTHVKQLIEDYKDKFGFHGKNFKLVFDGEDLELSETPESLDLENNDMIDIVEII